MVAGLPGVERPVSERDLYHYHHGRHVCTPTEAVFEEDPVRGHVRLIMGSLRAVLE